MWKIKKNNYTSKFKAQSVSKDSKQQNTES